MKDMLLGASLLVNVLLLYGYKIYTDQCKKQIEEFKKQYKGN